MKIYGPFLKIYGPFETFFGPFLVEQKTSSGSVDATTAKKSKNFFLVTGCIWFVLDGCFDWSKSHCCWHWNYCKEDYAFDHIHFEFFEFFEFFDFFYFWSRLNLILIIFLKFWFLIYDRILVLHMLVALDCPNGSIICIPVSGYLRAYLNKNSLSEKISGCSKMNNNCHRDS